MNGWIKIHRKLLDNQVVCKDTDHLAVWMYLLLNASHNVHSQLYGGKTVELRPGQLITGRRVIGEKLNINETKVWRILQLFQLSGQISIKTQTSGTLVTVLAWNEYQSEQNVEQQNEQRSEQQSEQQKKPCNADKTRVCEMLNSKSEQQNEQRSEQQSEHNQEVFKKNNNKKKTVPKGTAKEKRVFFCDPSVDDAFNDYIEHRKQIRSPMTERAITLAINKLNSISRDPEMQCRILEQSILNGWKGLFPLHDGENVTKNKFSAIDEFLKAGDND